MGPSAGLGGMGEWLSCWAVAQASRQLFDSVSERLYLGFQPQQAFFHPILACIASRPIGRLCAIG